MKIRKLIERRIRRAAPGITIESDVNAVVAANVGERNSVTKASSTQSATARRGPGTELTQEQLDEFARLRLAAWPGRSSRSASRRPR